MRSAVWIWIVIAALILVVLVLTVLLSKVKIRAEVLKHDKDDYARLQIHMLYGLVRLQYEIPFVILDGFRKGIIVQLDKYDNLSKDQGEKQNAAVDKNKVGQLVDNLRRLIKNTASLEQWLKKTFAHITLYNLRWTTKLGMQDCSQTAILTGAVWAVKSSFVGWTTGHVRYACIPDISVIPSWEQRNLFSTNVVCNASISMAYVIISLIKLLVRILKVRGSFKVWKEVLTGGSSSPKAHQ